MGDLNDIYQIVGNLQAQAEARQRQNADIYNKLDDVTKLLVQLNSSVSNHMDKCAVVERRVVEVEHVQNQHAHMITQVKTYGRIGAMLWSILGAGGIATLWNYLKGAA